MWELGFCQCLNKNIIPLTRSKKDIPFNISGTDYCEYELSIKGVNILIDNLQTHFKNIIRRIKKEKCYLYKDEHITDMLVQINRHLKDMSTNSLTKELVYYEFERIYRRISSLKDGKFDLRREKPITEIIECYCDFLEQLDGEDSEFLAITCSDFWKEITELGLNTQYIEANSKAVENGASIKRVFILNNKTIKFYNENFNNVVKNTLHDHLDLVQKYGREKVAIKVINADGNEERKIYNNFGILVKSNESILFEPEYNKDNEMIVTQFTHSVKDASVEIKRKLSLFNRVFNMGEWLEDSNFG